ncbi:MAG: carboxymuconolactone decarboxylase family protein [Gammaproteobacteria bacterium]|nr:carboxymuconolactone decarboxylase family protein [Gammaproteobacteria bacterium]
MSQFLIHTVESAPESSRAILAGARKALGFVPNLYAKLAEAPAALEAYKTLSGIFEGTSLSPVEQQVVLLTVSVENGCEFCVAAHSVIAKHMVKTPPAIVEAIRDRLPLTDARLEALAEFTRQIVRERGWVSGSPAEGFFSAGFTKQQALEVVLGVSLKTLSNYANHLVDTPVNTEFASEAWSRK